MSERLESRSRKRFRQTFVDLEFAWLIERDRDTQAQAETDQVYLQSGVKTVNEVRAAQGLAPLAGGDTATILAGNALVPLAQATNPLPPAPLPQAGKGGARAPGEGVVKYSPDQPRDDHGRWTDGGGGGDSDTGANGGDGSSAAAPDSPTSAKPAREIQVADSGQIMTDAAPFAPQSSEVAASDYYGGNDMGYLSRALGMDRDRLRAALHSIKNAAGLGGAASVIVHIPTGNVIFNGEVIGNLHDE